jgi:hypothetical protein
MVEVVDGPMYPGVDESVYPSPANHFEPSYQQELRRRARIIKEQSGQDFAAVIDELVTHAVKARDGGSK